MWSDDEYRSDSSADDDARSAQCTQEADDGEALSEREDRGDWQKQQPAKKQRVEWATSKGILSPSEYFATFGDTRDDRAGRLLQEQGADVRKLGSGRWFVPSQSGMAGGYEVCLSDVPSCSCPDFEKRHSPCKHIKAAQALA